MAWTLPNLLTAFRLLAAPAVALVFVLLPRPFSDMAALGLFVVACATDWLDGRLARAWGYETRFGAMLDPIADKAMVTIVLALLCGLIGLTVWIVVPVALILFREVFVSGLREYLGPATAGLPVTRLAKWKTTVQMVAIAVLLARGIFEHYAIVWTIGMSPDIVAGVLAGDVEDVLGLRRVFQALTITTWTGTAALWIAAALTLATGIGYFRTALPHLREDPRDHA